jgi:hypothetical protein
MYVDFDLSGFVRRAQELGSAADQVPFALSLAMNRAVRDTREHLIAQTWPRNIKQRNPTFIRASLTTEWAKKNDLEVSIYDKLERGHLLLHAKGGTRQPQMGRRHLAVPSRNIRKGAHGAPKAQKPRNLRDAVVFNNIIFQQTGSKKNRKLKAMYFLKTAVRIPKRVPFFEDFADQMKQHLNQELPGAVRQAMATRR